MQLVDRKLSRQQAYAQRTRKSAQDERREPSRRPYNRQQVQRELRDWGLA